MSIPTKVDVLDIIDVDGKKHVVTAIDIHPGNVHTVSKSVPIKRFLEENLVVTVNGQPMRLSDYLDIEAKIIVDRGGLCGWRPMIGN